MYNYFKSQKDIRKKKQIDNTASQYLAYKRYKSLKNERLANNYSRRVESFIINSINDPICIKKYESDGPHKFREQNKHKMLGKPNIIFNKFMYQKQRIAQIIKQHSSLDYYQTNHISLHQFRQRDIHRQRQLHPSDMRFKAKTSLQRVQQFLQFNTLGQLEKSKQNFKQGQRLLPILHKKTHFNAISQVSLNIGLQSSLARQKNFKQQKTKLSHSQNFDPIITSKQVLKKSNFVAQKISQKYILRKGKGHLSFDPNTNIDEAYKKIKLKRKKIK